MEKSDLSDTGTSRLHEDVNDFIALFLTDEVLDILLDYLYSYENVQKFVAYVQSEEFPKIHTLEEYLKQYKNVSAFMYMKLKPQCDKENICSISTCG